MKPHRTRVTHDLICAYGLDKKMTVVMCVALSIAPCDIRYIRTQETVLAAPPFITDALPSLL
jgi:hypothetical protein